MKRKYKILILLTVVITMVSLTTVPAFALTESQVQDQVNAIGKEGVTGNIFVWFLCAIAFLKVSQKIDSFMSSLGINVGHTGGSMLAEAMIAVRGIGAAKSFVGRGGGGGSSSSGGSGGNTFMKGGLTGIVSRNVTKRRRLCQFRNREDRNRQYFLHRYDFRRKYRGLPDVLYGLYGSRGQRIGYTVLLRCGNRRRSYLRNRNL